MAISFPTPRPPGLGMTTLRITVSDVWVIKATADDTLSPSTALASERVLLYLAINALRLV